MVEILCTQYENGKMRPVETTLRMGERASAQQKKWSLNKDTTHRLGENICQLYIRQRTDNQNTQGT
jgi:hypothetical protein